MKFLLITFALIGIAVGISVPDSATQGPNPQDIATPEPEYIDIDGPEPPKAPAPAPQQRTFSAPRPIQRPVIQQTFSAPIVQQHFQQRPVAQASFSAPIVQHFQQQQQQLPGHSYSSQSGYQYRRPVYVRRFYRRRY